MLRLLDAVSMHPSTILTHICSEHCHIEFHVQCYRVLLRMPSPAGPSSPGCCCYCY
jgi:hypothetical protein